jgi:hypothetical protein
VFVREYVEDITYTTVNPKTDRKLIARLDARRTNNVDGQAVLVDRAAEALGIGTVANTHPTKLSSITRLLPSLIEGLGRGESK